MPNDIWHYRLTGPLAGRVLEYLRRTYEFEVFCVARPEGSPHPEEHVVLARLQPFTWPYTLTVNYDPWDQTPIAGGDAVSFQTDPMRLRPVPDAANVQPPSRRPRVGGVDVVDVQSRRAREAGLEPAR